MEPSLSHLDRERVVEPLAPNILGDGGFTLNYTSARQRRAHPNVGLIAGQLVQLHTTTRSLRTIPRTCLQQSQSIRNTEFILLQIKGYITWHLSEIRICRVQEASGVSPSIAYVMADSLTLAIGMLMNTQHRGGWGLFNAVCAFAKWVFHQQSRDLLRILLVLFYVEDWDQNKDLRLHLLKYFASLAYQVLGPQHPLALILRLLQAEGTLINSAQAALKLMLDLVSEQLGPFSPEVFRLKRSLVDLLWTQKDLESAVKICQSMVLDSTICYGRSHLRTRMAMSRLGRLYLEQQLDNEAENVFLEAFARGGSDHSPENLDLCGVDTLNSLACLYFLTQKHQLSRQYWRLAHEGLSRKSSGASGKRDALLEKIKMMPQADINLAELISLLHAFSNTLRSLVGLRTTPFGRQAGQALETWVELEDRGCWLVEDGSKTNPKAH